MTFQAFNQANNYFDAGNLSQTRFLQGVAAYFKSKPNMAMFQGCQRAMGSAAIQQGITTLFTSAPPVLTAAGMVPHLYHAVDQYWTNTVTVRGQQQLTNEQTTRLAYWTTGIAAEYRPDARGIRQTRRRTEPSCEPADHADAGLGIYGAADRRHRALHHRDALLQI